MRHNPTTHSVRITWAHIARQSNGAHTRNAQGARGVGRRVSAARGCAAPRTTRARQPARSHRIVRNPACSFLQWQCVAMKLNCDRGRKRNGSGVRTQVHLLSAAEGRSVNPEKETMWKDANGTKFTVRFVPSKRNFVMAGSSLCRTNNQSNHNRRRARTIGDAVRLRFFQIRFRCRCSLHLTPLPFE